MIGTRLFDKSQTKNQINSAYSLWKEILFGVGQGTNFKASSI